MISEDCRDEFCGECDWYDCTCNCHVPLDADEYEGLILNADGGYYWFGDGYGATAKTVIPNRGLL